MAVSGWLAVLPVTLAVPMNLAPPAQLEFAPLANAARAKVFDWPWGMAWVSWQVTPAREGVYVTVTVVSLPPAFWIWTPVMVPPLFELISGMTGFVVPALKPV